jgi:thiosulfate/3-mercaptopyruvate sulfurtransferase
VDVTFEELAGRLGEPGLVLLDVRTEHEFTGALGAPCDPRQGHIPGARHLELSTLVRRDPRRLRELVDAPEGAEVVCYCHSGSRSAMAVALLEGAGYRARNYAGSWHEWSRRGELPAETGP